MEALLQQQQDIIEAIKKVERNFSKDTASRKTRKYLDERLDAIDKLWCEFQVNNHKLTNYENDEEPYFTENQFQQVRSYFGSVRSKIASYPPYIETDINKASTSRATSRLPKLDIDLPSPTTEHQGAAAELLSLQRTNFRAFHRQVKGICIEEIREKWELEDELRNIQVRWNAIDTLHLQIDNILQGSDTTYDEEFGAYESNYKEVKRALNMKLASTVHLHHATPHIDIPIFTGKYTQWPTFFDLYVETIHNNNILTNAQKMQHLKGKLRGGAERLIQHLHISAENYETAWELLTHRYNNPQLLFTKQIEIFINQPIAHKQSAHEIRRLYDTSTECIHAIQNLGIDTSTWDPLLVHLIAKKLDSETYSDYKEARKSPRDLPSLSELMIFLEGKFNALEPINKKEKEIVTSSSKPYMIKTANRPSKPYYQHFRNNHFGKPQNREFQAIATSTQNCLLCNKNHFLYKCSKFNKLTPDERLMTVIKLSVCQNCLFVHKHNQCESERKCRVCGKKHNTMLHEAYANFNSMLQKASRPIETAESAFTPSATITQGSQIAPQHNNEINKEHSVNHVATDDEEILLTTLSVKVKSADGTYVILRALLDQGSQISLISENAAQMLGLPRQRYHASVSGIGNGSKQGKGIITLNCQSIYEDYEFTTQALVIKHVINNLPNMSFNKQSWSHLQHIQLADPEYNISRPIDLLLDGSIYSEIIMNGLIKGPIMAPIAQQTRLGWILSGNVKAFKCHVVINNLSEISQYWELEEINDFTPELTRDELYCEQLYQSTTKRLQTGRYEVAIPMNPGFQEHLGKSRSKAIAQFYNLEKKMANNGEFANAYKKFMEEYLKQGYMTPVTQHSEPSCYLLHHGVLKLDSTTTKLRTVFNASSKTSSGYSLNDLMQRGPNLQKDLQHLILVWRQHKYVITADIEKMFCRIFVREVDQHLQRIVWRRSPEDPLIEYQIRTVCFGNKAAPFLAMRTLKQLAMDDAHKFPLAASALKSSFYMDDLMEGCDDILEAKRLQQEIIEMLRGAGMNIRKWSSNSDELVRELSADQRDTPLDFKSSENRKTLGLQWNPISDTFTFQNKFQDNDPNAIITKRLLLSKISKIFDPLGWLSPLTVRAKLLFQRTWAEETTDWDKSLSKDVSREWTLLRDDFQKIEHFKIPRYLGERNYKIHAFCDASEKAYACAIYVITQNSKGKCTSTLVIAKTKLAPLKNKLTLPKLELCAALLLSRLVKKVMDTLREEIQIYAWTDSMVVLGWLHGDVNRWKQFVANRVRMILNVVPASSWHHVRSEENAADCATRGLSSLQLTEHNLWWQGPKWLPTIDPDMIKDHTYQPPAMEAKKTKLIVNTALHYKNELVVKLLHEYSSLHRMVTTIGWLSRYVHWLRNKKQTARQNYLLTTEMQLALNLIVKTAQSIDFEDDIYNLRKQGKLKKDSKLASLSAYIDESDGLLKVGGRLNNSLLSQSAKHPIILKSHSKLTEVIIRQAHSATLHGGPSLTLSYIREKYWILSGLRTVKRELRKWVKCRRFKEEKKTQIMADLPEPRVTPSRPFTHTGVDFTGHFDIRANRGRGVRTHKGYVAVFVCLSTKAVHLELVSDLTTPGFLAAFRRFCARRAVPKHMYSDQGRNSIGASKALKKEYAEIMHTLDGSVAKCPFRKMPLGRKTSLSQNVPFSKRPFFIMSPSQNPSFAKCPLY